MSATDATHDQQPDDAASFVDHDFGGDAASTPTPEHVDPYASRDDDAPRTSPVTIQEQVDPYSSRD